MLIEALIFGTKIKKCVKCIVNKVRENKVRQSKFFVKNKNDSILLELSQNRKLFN